MSMVEGLKNAAAIIANYHLKSVISVDCDSQGTRIQIYDETELEKISNLVTNETKPNISRTYVMISGVKIFAVTSDVSNWLEEIA
ncbi:hypothetical protein ACTHOQ_14210 [Solibacillus silvestris]|uniref:hypothetical protein n=1 Tax=Solibacillus silvestris TaxID=76853 RepID=UPI003F7E01C5